MQKKMKVLVSVMAVTLLSGVLAGCGGASLGGNDSGDAKVTKKASAKVKIGASISTLNNPFFVSVKKGINDAAKDTKNVQIFDAQNDTAKQSNDIEDMIQKKVDVLIINPVDSSAIAASVKDANDAGIPVITVDRSSSSGKVLTLVSSNSTKGGQMAAKFMIENYKVSQVLQQPENVVKGLKTLLKVKSKLLLNKQLDLIALKAFQLRKTCYKAIQTFKGSSHKMMKWH